jgi:hypothetical protein
MEERRFRSRSILISTRQGQRVFGSADEVPPDLRRPLEKALEGELTTTILIADERGRQEALRRLRHIQQRPQEPAFPYARQAALAGIGALLLWLLATLR